jgi:hypothetical protein
VTGPFYDSPVAFRSALTARLKNTAKTSRWTLTQLQRQFAYDRLLERLYLADQDWIVKGATALLARDIGVRGSLDIDVYRNAARQQAEADLRAAAARDIGDWFRFDLGNSQIMDNATGGLRIPVTAYVGATPWAEFHVDLVGSDVRMTGVPDDVPALARVVMPDVEQHGYRAYPSSTTSPTRSQRSFSATGRRRRHRLAIAISSTSLPSRRPPQCRRPRRSQRSTPNSSAASSPCRLDSMSQTVLSGTVATRLPLQLPCCRLHIRWTTRWRS